jgi:DNA-binding beta-propeller fold protein YncE
MSGQWITALLCAASVAVSGDAVSYKKDKEIPLPGTGGFDYLSVDAAGRRLLVAHSTCVEVLDIDKGEVVGKLEGVEGAHGAIIVADVDKGFATAGKKNMLLVFDTKSLKVTKEIPTGANPDAVLYVATTKEVWTMNHTGGTITCVDAATLEVKATIEVGGKLEFAQEYATKGLVFVNAEDKSFVGVIDAKTHKLTTSYPLAPAAEPTGMACDQKNGLLFCGCDKMLAVVDIASGKVIATPEIGGGCDAVAFDAEKGLVFASCGDGTTSIVRVVDAKTFEAAGKIETAPGARTCTLDLKTHKLYVGAGTRGKDDVRVLVFAPEAKPAPASAPKK